SPATIACLPAAKSGSSAAQSAVCANDPIDEQIGRASGRVAASDAVPSALTRATERGCGAAALKRKPPALRLRCRGMCWHVLGMMRSRGNPCVFVGGSKHALGQRWVIVAVDEIVQRTGVVRLRDKDLFEDRSSLELVGVGLVTGQRSFVQR